MRVFDSRDVSARHSRRRGRCHGRPEHGQTRRFGFRRTGHELTPLRTPNSRPALRRQRGAACSIGPTTAMAFTIAALAVRSAWSAAWWPDCSDAVDATNLRETSVSSRLPAVHFPCALNPRSAGPAAARFPETAAAPRSARRAPPAPDSARRRTAPACASPVKRSTQATAMSAWPMRVAEPVRRGDGRALLFQHLQHAADLGLATLDPDFRRHPCAARARRAG